MSSEAVGFPFYRLDDKTVQTDSWTLRSSGRAPEEAAPLTQSVDSWDYLVDLSFSRIVSFDSDEVLRQCRLSPGSVIRIAVIVSTARQRIRRTLVSQDFNCSGSSGRMDALLDFELPGNSIQGDLRLDTEISVCSGQSADETDPFVPVKAGCRLWSDSVTTALEGGLSRFPVSSVSFRKVFGDVSSAPWMLQWSPDDLESNAASAMRLYLNEDSPVFEEIRNGESPLRVVMQSDVLRQLLVTLLLNEEFNPEPEAWPEFSLGRFASAWMLNIFGEESVEIIRAKAQSEPGWPDARIQSYIWAQHGN